MPVIPSTEQITDPATQSNPAGSGESGGNPAEKVKATAQDHMSKGPVQVNGIVCLFLWSRTSRHLHFKRSISCEIYPSLDGRRRECNFLSTFRLFFLLIR